MKNTLLCITLLLLFMPWGFSQSLTLSDSQGPIPNNSTLLPHGSSGDDEIIAYAYVTNNSSAAIPVLVKKVEVFVTPGTTNTFCWGLCYPPNIFISSESITIGPGETNYIDFSGHLAPNGISGYSILRYVFYDELNPSDTVCMNVHFAHFPVGVESSPPIATLSLPGPNPAHQMVRLGYRFPQGAKATITLSTSTGSIVGEESLVNPSGNATINTSSLPDGIYLCVLNVDGRPAMVRKLIVTH